MEPWLSPGWGGVATAEPQPSLRRRRGMPSRTQPAKAIRKSALPLERCRWSSAPPDAPLLPAERAVRPRVIAEPSQHSTLEVC